MIIYFALFVIFAGSIYLVVKVNDIIKKNERQEDRDLELLKKVQKKLEEKENDRI